MVISIHDTQSAQLSQKENGRSIYPIMKTMCPPGYHHNDFVATYALWHIMHNYILLVSINKRMLNKPSKEHKREGTLYS